MLLLSVTKFSNPRRGLTTTGGGYSKQTITTTQRSYSSSSSSSSCYCNNYSNYFRLASVSQSRVSVSVSVSVSVVPELSQRKRVNYFTTTTSTTSTSSTSTSEVEEDQVSKTLAEIESLLKNITDKRHKSTSQAQPSSVDTSSSFSSGSNSFSSSNSAATSTSDGDSLSQASNEAAAPVQSDPNALSNLKYMKYYPKIVRQWVIDAKTPKGIFNKFGEWETVPDTGENLSKLATQMIAQKALEGDPYADKQIPKDLVGHYRFGIQPDEIENCHPKIKELFSFKYASQKEINAFRRKQIVKEIGKSPGNSGSSAVQVAILTDRINYMTEHLKKHPKDKSNQRGLMTLLETRRGMMKYLKRTNVAAYYNVLRKIGLRDMLP